MALAVNSQWTRVRTLGRGASGAEVFLAADDVSGELFAVKSVGPAGAAGLMREQGVMAGLRCPHLVPCIGGHGGRDGSYQLFLEFAPGGSIADAVARNGGRLDERAVRGYAADVATGLAYLHGMGLVHGDVKARNIVIGSDGRAKLADFGCSRKAGSGGPIGGTPAFMAPEVARGEEQGPAADVWALGCTIVEMATGRTPWSDMDDVLPALHRIGYTEAVPEIPQWLSAEAKDFLGGCLTRRSSDRCTAAQLLEHPFLASAGCDGKLEAVKSKWTSPKSTLDAAFWESDAEEADDELSYSTAERIRALACPASALPDWDSDEGWIDVISTPTQASDAASVPVEETRDPDGVLRSGQSRAEAGLVDTNVDISDSAHNVGEADDESHHEHSRHKPLENLLCHEISCKLCKLLSANRNNAIEFVLAQILVLAVCTAALFLHSILPLPHCVAFSLLNHGNKNLPVTSSQLNCHATHRSFQGEKDGCESTRKVHRQSGRRKDPERKNY